MDERVKTELLGSNLSKVHCGRLGTLLKLINSKLQWSRGQEPAYQGRGSPSRQRAPPQSFQHILPAGKQISNVESSGRLLLHTNVELGMTMQFNPSHKVKTGSYLCRYWCQYLTFVWLSPCRKLISTHQVLTQAIRAASEILLTPHPPVLHWQEGGVRVGKDILWQWEGKEVDRQHQFLQLPTTPS